MLTVEEAMKMVGTEFDYIYEDGDTVRSYVKKFDPEIGLTCLTLETESLRGWKGLNKEPDGTWCIMAHDFKFHSLKGALRDLSEISKTGRFSVFEKENRHGSIKCAFMN